MPRLSPFGPRVAFLDRVYPGSVEGFEWFDSKGSGAFWHVPQSSVRGGTEIVFGQAGGAPLKDTHCPILENVSNITNDLNEPNTRNR